MTTGRNIHGQTWKKGQQGPRVPRHQVPGSRQDELQDLDPLPEVLGPGHAGGRGPGLGHRPPDSLAQPPQPHRQRGRPLASKKGGSQSLTLAQIFIILEG